MAGKINLSKREEMYLVTIRRICEHCADAAIPIPDIAAALDVQPVSVNQMIKKLAEAGLVVYTPYRGVGLTDDGKAISTKILRHRRLWEVFLVKDLKMALDEADALACQLEHITSDDVADRLSVLLDNPSVCFHGDPIYSAEKQTEVKSAPLSNVKVGQPFHVVRLEGDEALISFLSDAGIIPGIRGSIIAASKSDNLLLEIGYGERITVTRQVADQIFVEEQFV
jgi:DtxR family Mn-dependent transcriptional regulator